MQSDTHRGSPREAWPCMRIMRKFLMCGTRGLAPLGCLRSYRTARREDAQHLLRLRRILRILLHPHGPAGPFGLPLWGPTEGRSRMLHPFGMKQRDLKNPSCLQVIRPAAGEDRRSSPECISIPGEREGHNRNSKEVAKNENILNLFIWFFCKRPK